MNQIFLAVLLLAGFNAFGQKKQSSIKGKTICIDPGHGGTAATDSYRVGPGGEREEWIDLRVGLMLQTMLEEKGAKVVMTRTEDVVVPLLDRSKIAVEGNAELFVSIHHNATPKGAPVVFGGIEVYVSKLNSNIKIAEELGAGILSKLKQADGITVQDSLKNASLLLLRESKTPAVLIELGNITDQKSLDFIKQEANLRKIGNLILDGFVVFSKRGC